MNKPNEPISLLKNDLEIWIFSEVVLNISRMYIVYVSKNLLIDD